MIDYKPARLTAYETWMFNTYGPAWDRRSSDVLAVAQAAFYAGWEAHR